MMRSQRKRAVRLPRTSGERNLQIQIGPLLYREAVGSRPIQVGAYMIVFFVRYYVDDGIMVEMQSYRSGVRCLMASTSLASDHFRLFGERSSGDPPLLSARKNSSWDTQLEVLGWEIQ